MVCRLIERSPTGTAPYRIREFASLAECRSKSSKSTSDFLVEDKVGRVVEYRIR
jgi:hypothetical protein